VDHIAAAQALVEQKFPDCDAAFLVGSTVRSEATPTSDLDIVVISRSATAPYQEGMKVFGWPIDVVFHTESSYRKFFKIDVLRRRPVLAYMINEGVILKNKDGYAYCVKEEAKEALAAGPAPLTAGEIMGSRHELTKLYDDFTSSASRIESLILGADLAYIALEFVLSFNCQWMGDGKWAVRALRDYNPELADEFLRALEDFYQRNQKDGLACFAQNILDAAGGRTSEEYILGRKPLVEAEELGTIG
jgi:predicted nucleotidyltransferase